MARQKTVGFMIYAADTAERSVFTDEKYAQIAAYFIEHGIDVRSISYNSEMAAALHQELAALDGLLVWVNPIEHGEDRRILDALLADIAARGVVVSARPETIHKIGTKRVLFDTRAMEWGSDVQLYTDLDDFRARFMASLAHSKIRVLKQFRGDGVFKVSLGERGEIDVLHARRGSIVERMDIDGLFHTFAPYFADGKPLLDQAWNDAITNGVVRCYMAADRVAGFGYQEINALHPSQTSVAPGRRYYYTERCGLFSDLKAAMETTWVPQLMQTFALASDDLPLIWDADFFINEVHTRAPGKYTLCEINVSCVSPFPESAVQHIFEATLRRIGGGSNV